MHKDNHPLQQSTSTGTSATMPRPVNEAGNIHVSGFVRIFDPKTQETLVEARE